MAKISANHSSELDRYVKGEWTYVFTSDGRILRKLKGGSYSLVYRHITTVNWQKFRSMLASQPH